MCRQRSECSAHRCPAPDFGLFGKLAGKMSGVVILFFLFRQAYYEMRHQLLFSRVSGGNTLYWQNIGGLGMGSS